MAIRSDRQDCFGLYRSSDSYIIGTADYNRWLNCELNNEFADASVGNEYFGNSNNLLNILVSDFGSNPPVTNTPTTNTPTTNTSLMPLVNQTIVTESKENKIIELAKKNPLFSFIAVLGISYLVFK